MKRPALQNKQVVLLRIAFRARKILGTFEKRAPGESGKYHQSMKRVIRELASCFAGHVDWDLSPDAAKKITINGWCGFVLL